MLSTDTAALICNVADYRNVSRPLEGRATNNHAEIEAATEAARQATRAGITNLKINTDSQFLVDCAKNWIPKWKANGWKTANNEPVINKSELIKMEKAFAPLNVELVKILVVS